jgi:hypothetical protein
MFKKRGQAAMEFLMTYGWAILVLLGAIIALSNFGVLNPDNFRPNKCIFTGSARIFCEDYNVEYTYFLGFIHRNIISLVLVNTDLYDYTFNGDVEIGP